MIRFLHKEKRKVSRLMLLLSGMLVSTGLSAQCPVKATASKVDILCGDTVKLNAIGTPGFFIFVQDFNNACPGLNWVASSSADCSNPCGNGPNGSTDPHLWMSSLASAPRQVVTGDYDLTLGGTICFDMRYAEEEPQEGCPPVGACNCEGPDLPDEGVHLQYSNNGGTTWIEIQYWNPNGGHDPLLVKWNNHCVTIPPGAMTTSTRFRWFQTASSGSGSDHWGIDNVKISLNDPNYRFDWQHDGLPPSVFSNTPDVIPNASTTYTVTYTDNNGNTCTGNVAVNVTLPTATATVSPALICPNGTVQLNVETSYKNPLPTTCAGTPIFCNSTNSQAGEYTVGTGTTVNGYNSAGPEAFGDFGDAHIRSQILYRASELKAAGFNGGKITNIQFEVARIDANATTPNLTISMRCTNVTTMNAFQGGLTTVYNTKPFTAQLGWNTLTFDQGYDWDGTSNIIVEICSYLANGESANDADWGVFTRDNNPGYNAWRHAGTNFSDANCTLTDFQQSYSQRPNTRFGVCEPRNVTLVYNWSGAGLSSASVKNPTANVPSSGIYTVTVNPQGLSQCAFSTSVPVDVANPVAVVNPNPATVCPPGSPNVVLDGVPSTTTGSGSFVVTFNNTASQAIPDNNTTGITKTIAVNSITPPILTAGSINSVCMNITHPDVGDLQVSLTSPSGNTINLYNRTVANGTNFSETCFTEGAAAVATGTAPFSGFYAPVQAFLGLTGNVNGTWTLTVKDLAKPALGSSPGTFQNWRISFNHTGTNFVKSYSWSPATALSSTNTASTTASPTASTTYTVQITDALGCTASQTVAVGYCVAVPVDLASFSAVKAGSDVNISWSTLTQINTAYFVVERSVDGVNFTEIGRVEGAGNYTGLKKYSLTDGEPFRTNVYRLKNVDFNGSHAYSNLVQVDFDLASIQNIYPNPIRDEINYDIYIAGSEEVEVVIEVVNMLGEVKHLEQREFRAGDNSAKTLLSGLAQGAYTIRLKNTRGETLAYKTFIKS
jgi:subtilisin-like proprotein convertase family protein